MTLPFGSTLWGGVDFCQEQQYLLSGLQIRLVRRLQPRRIDSAISSRTCFVTCLPLSGTLRQPILRAKLPEHCVQLAYGNLLYVARIVSLL